MLDDEVQDYKTPLYALLAATGCVLLIACMNVASLLVARTAAKGRELAIRAALGGGRMRLLRERFVETLLLAAAGGTLGWLLAWGALQWLVHARAGMNRVEAIHLDGVVATFTVGVVGLCALFSGLISALGSGGKDILSALQESSRGHSAGAGRAQLRRILLVLEVGLTVVLLVGAGLLLKSYQRLRTADIGVPVDNVLTMQISLPEARYKQETQVVTFFEQLIARVRALPGAQTVGLVSKAPGEGWGGDHMMTVVEHPPQPLSQVPDIMVRLLRDRDSASARAHLYAGRAPGSRQCRRDQQDRSADSVSRRRSNREASEGRIRTRHLAGCRRSGRYALDGFSARCRHALLADLREQLQHRDHRGPRPAQCRIAGPAGAEGDRPARPRSAGFRRDDPAGGDWQVHRRLRV
jgi:putative ABC transport system permease protein